MAKIYVTRTITAPVEQVWTVIRDFNALPQWHPAVASSRIEEGLPGDAVGCIRNFQLQNDGGAIREQLLALSDIERQCTYTILDGPIPVQNYRATLRLIEITEEASTLGEWRAEFETTPQEEATAIALVSGIFRDGLENLNKQLVQSGVES